MRDDHHDFNYFWNKLGAGHQERMKTVMEDMSLSSVEKNRRLEAISAEFGECVHLTAGGLDGLWHNNQSRLYEMAVDGSISAIASQIEEVERRVKEYRDELGEYLRKIANGLDYLPLWFDGQQNYHELLMGQWLQHASLDHFKKIFAAIAPHLEKSSRRFLQSPLFTFMTEEQMVWVAQEYKAKLIEPALAHFFSYSQFKDVEEDQRLPILFDLAIKGMDELPIVRCHVGRLILCMTNIDMLALNAKGVTRFNNACVLHPELALPMLKRLPGDVSQMLNTIDSQQGNALRYAAISGHVPLMRELIARGAMVDDHILFATITASRPEAFRFVYALVNQFNLDLLMLACEYFQENIVGFLYGQAESAGVTAQAAQMMLEFGIRQKCGKVVQFVVCHTVLRENAGENAGLQAALHAFVNLADARTVKALIRYGVSMDVIDEASGRSEYAAVVCHSFDICVALILKNESKVINYRRDDAAQGQSALFLVMYDCRYPGRLKDRNFAHIQAMIDYGVRNANEYFTLLLSEMELKDFKLKFSELYQDEAQRPQLFEGWIRVFDLLTPAQRSWLVNEYFDTVFKPMIEEKYPTPFVRAENWNEVLLSLANHGSPLFYILFYKHGINRNYSSPTRGCALLIAVRENENKMFDFMISHDDIDLEAHGVNGETALILAADGWRPEMVTSLLRKGVHLDTVDNHGNNALFCATHHTSNGIFISLLPAISQGASADDFLDTKAFSIKIMTNMVNHVNKKGISALSELFFSGDAAKLQHLLDMGMSVDTVITATGRTLLREAVQHKQLTFIFILLLAGASTSLRNGPWEHTAEDLARAYGDKQALKLFKLFKIDKFVPDLHLWSARNDREARRVVKMLTQYDSYLGQLNRCNAELNTPLMIAASHGNEQHVILLLKAGATLGLRNRKGATALTLARDNKHESICVLLGKHKLNEYYRIREQRGEATSFFGSMFGPPTGCDKTSKLLAAEALIRILNGWESYVVSLKPDEKPDLRTYLVKAASTVPSKCRIAINDADLREICVEIMGEDVLLVMLARIPEPTFSAQPEKKGGAAAMLRKFF